MSTEIEKPPPFSRITEYYNLLVDRHGHDPRACDYGRAESQLIKFKVLSEMLDYSGKSVLDVGCGFADYARFLEDRYEGVRYTGIDLSPRMIAEARKLRPDLDLRVGNVLAEEGSETFDVVIANGIFYLLREEAPSLMAEMVRRMFDLAKIALGFNTLSAWAPDPEPGEFHADPLDVLRLGRSLTSRLVLRHDYHSRDFTIYIYKKVLI